MLVTIDPYFLKHNIPLVLVLAHYRLLAKMHDSGNEIVGACPIHKGHNSTVFRINTATNSWQCVSHCGCTGDVIEFVAKMEHVSAAAAIKLLIRWFQLEGND